MLGTVAVHIESQMNRASDRGYDVYNLNRFSTSVSIFKDRLPVGAEANVTAYVFPGGEVMPDFKSLWKGHGIALTEQQLGAMRVLFREAVNTQSIMGNELGLGRMNRVHGTIALSNLVRHELGHSVASAFARDPNRRDHPTGGVMSPGLPVDRLVGYRSVRPGRNGAIPLKDFQGRLAKKINEMLGK
jgi:hypothetical protein